MSDLAANEHALRQAPPRRGWLIVLTIGCALIMLALAVLALVMVDKTHFGWLVGSLFLEIIMSGVMVGAIAVLLGTLMLPQRKSWRGVVLLAWGLVALTSPAFGMLFLLPWGVLVIGVPLVIGILLTFFRNARRDQPA